MSRAPLLALLALTGCYISHWPLTPAIESRSVYEALVPVNGKVGIGTAWVVAPGRLITAGHVCEMALSGTGDVYLVGHTALRIPARPITWSTGNVDLCLLSADDRLLGPALVVARAWPGDGTPTFSEGWPGGLDTLVSGMTVQSPDVRMMTHPGASGSPVSTAAGVIGVVVASPCPVQDCSVVDDGTAVTAPVEILRDFLSGVGVEPLSPPFRGDWEKDHP